MTDRQLTFAEIGTLVGISVTSARTMRSHRERSGRLPEPDGRTGRQVWWYESTVTRWWAGRQVPAGVWTTSEVAELFGLSRSVVNKMQRRLPPADGRSASGRVWWWPGPIQTWWADEQARRTGLWDLEAIAKYTNRETYALDTSGHLPEPAVVTDSGTRWWRRAQVRSWWRQHLAKERAANQWYSQDVAANTGLTMRACAPIAG